jgi:hypothetical protein
MPFRWSSTPEDQLANRYPENAVGYEEWQAFIRDLSDLFGRDIGPELEPAVHAIADRFFDTTRELIGHPVPPRVFVSHQRADAGYAERIAYLACNAGIDYWLDIHDPRLRILNRPGAAKSPLYPVIVAAIVEMALLNSTHVVAVQTHRSLQSKWVPYEFGRALGRAREHRMKSRNAGSWFEPGIDVTQFGEYVLLARRAAGGERDLVDWFTKWAPVGGNCQWVPPSAPPSLP